MKKSSEIFAETLTELMEDSRMGVSQLASLINCDTAAIRRWLYNMYLPDPQTVIKIADAFNVSADYLFGLSDNKEFVKSENNETFYVRYSRLRDANNYSDYIISKECKIRDSAVSKWKSIKNYPSTVSLLKLSQYFNCSLDYLLGHADN